MIHALFTQGGNSVIQVGVIGQIPKSEEDDSSFEATVTFILNSDENGGAPSLPGAARKGIENVRQGAWKSQAPCFDG